MHHEGRALVGGVNGFIRDPKALWPLPPGRTWGEVSVTLKRPHPTMRAPDLCLPASGTVRNKFLLYISHPVCGILFIAAPGELRQWAESFFFSYFFLISLNFPGGEPEDA